MWIFLSFLLFFIGFVTLYVVWLRTWLKAQPWALNFMDTIEPVETFLYKKSETLLWSRMLMVVGALGPLADVLGFVQPSHIEFFLERFNLERLVAWSPMIFIGLGLVSEYLRRTTTRPVEVIARPRDEGGN